MNFAPLPYLSVLADYDRAANTLRAAHRAGAADALEFVRQHHPRYRRPDVAWLPQTRPPELVAADPFEVDDARLTLARAHDFADWPALAEHVAAVTQRGSPTFAFERGVEAVVAGDLATLEELLRAQPQLAAARSTRRTSFHPAVHAATWLHYVAANGVERWRQRTPANAVAVAATLLAAGTDVDARASVYGGRFTTLALLVSSSPPAQAGLQVALTHLLLDHGAAVDGDEGPGSPTSPLLTALAFGHRATADALAARGACTATLAAAAGLGRVDDVANLLPTAGAAERHRALALAAQHGHVAVTGMLLDAGEPCDRFNPAGLHAHSTPLHQAALAGHLGVVQLLVERGARLDQRDHIHGGTPLDWARHAQRTAVVAFLAADDAGAR